MTAFLKLFCDISVYYALIMYLGKVLGNTDYFLPGFFFLVLMCACAGFVNEKAEKHPALMRLTYLIPAAALVFRPSLIQCCLIVPVWLWCVYSLEKKTYDFTYYEAKQLCTRECLLIFIAYISVFFMPSYIEAIKKAAFYLAIALCAMVLQLRYFRQEKTGPLISMGLVASVLSLSGIFAYFHVFAFAGRFLRAVYLWLVSQLFHVVTPETFSFMNELQLQDAGDVETGGIPLPSEGNPEISVIAPLKEMSVFEKVLIILLIIALIAIVCAILFGSMKGHRFHKRSAEEEISEKVSPKKKRRIALFAPNDAREAVRWYYAKYLHECVKRGLVIRNNVTSAEVKAASVSWIDEKTASDFRQLYIKARYSSEHISRADADMAKQYWRTVKNQRQV